MLEPDKIALAVIYYMHAVQDAEADAAGIAKALGNVASKNVVASQLDRLFDLGLVVGSGPLPMGIGGQLISMPEWWSITHDGAKYAHTLIQQPKSFMGRLHANGLGWLASDEARQAKLSTKLSKVDVYSQLHDTAVGIASPAATPRGLQAPIASGEPVNWTKWGAILTGLGVAAAVLIAAFS